jgi:O-acetyl-ADP-ribose deacetylase (regulator of RNase III)
MGTEDVPPNGQLPLELRIGTVDVQLRADRLETLVHNTRFDAIVSTDDSMLSMEDGVSAIIASLAGRGIRDEVASQIPLPVGAIAVTSGGNLSAQYVIHAVTVDRNNHVLPTRRTVRQLTREILTRCEALRIRRLVLPPPGTGRAKLDPDITADVVATCIREHTVNSTVLRAVILPVSDAETFEAFARALRRTCSEQITGLPDEIDNPSAESSLARSSDHPPGAPPSRESRGLRPAGSPAPPTLGFTTTRVESTEPRKRRPRAVQAVISNDSSRPLLNHRYVLLEEIGRGGTAVVYLAWDLVLRRTVAIKILQSECADPQALRREAGTAIELTHDSIVRLYHFEPEQGSQPPHLVMEYVPWPSGEKWIADAGENGLPVRAVRDVGIHLCEALAYAHSRQVLHLDIKPANVFVDPAGESVKLGDFGLARSSGSGGSALQVKPAGTPAYMAPEQYTAGARVTTATDMYQMAATMWDFLTGTPPRSPIVDEVPYPSDRRILLATLREALIAEPAARPTAIRLRDIFRESVHV